MRKHVLSLTSAPIDDEAVRALLDAAGAGDLARINALLNQHPAIINERAGEGTRTALHRSVFGGRVEATRLLLERGADPNIRCEGDNATPLHFAAEKQNFPMIRLLIEHGADPIGEGDDHELEVIGWATSWEYVQASPEIADYLLAHGARHNIWSAVSMGDTGAIRKLCVEFPANLERRMDRTNRRRRPLHLAVIKQQLGSLSTLLELGANTEALDEAFLTALDQAALLGEKEAAQRLLEAGAKMRLPAAIALDRQADAARLLRRDPDCLQPGQRWGTLLVRAAERSSGDVVEALIRAGASVNVRDHPKTAIDGASGYTPLHGAAWFGNRGAVEALLRHGADVRAREELWRGTPAGWADYAGHKEVRDLILAGPIDLIEAVSYGLADRIPDIVAQEPEALNRRYGDYPLYPIYAEAWYTPLAFAAIRGDEATVRVLLELGADGAIHKPDGSTLLVGGL